MKNTEKVLNIINDIIIGTILFLGIIVSYYLAIL